MGEGKGVTLQIPPPDCSLSLSFLMAETEELGDHRVHLEARYAHIADEIYVFVFSFDWRVPSDPGNPANTGWVSLNADTTVDVPLGSARALHAWLGFMIAQIDGGVFPKSKREDEGDGRASSVG